jgi:hypothetical protein
MVIFHSYVTVVNQRVYDSLSFHINIIIYYQYVVNLKQGKPTFCCWICSQELRRPCCESPCTCGRWGMPRSHDVSQIHEVRLCQSQLFEGCVSWKFGVTRFTLPPQGQHVFGLKRHQAGAYENPPCSGRYFSGYGDLSSHFHRYRK